MREYSASVLFHQTARDEWRSPHGTYQRFIALSRQHILKCHVSTTAAHAQFPPVNLPYVITLLPYDYQISAEISATLLRLSSAIPDAARRPMS